MIRLTTSTLVLCLVLSCPAHAADKVCAPLCAADQQSCRADAQKKTEMDTMPGLGTPQRTSANAGVGEVQSRFEQQRPTAAGEFRRRRAERLLSCDTAHQRCLNACPQK